MHANSQKQFLKLEVFLVNKKVLLYFTSQQIVRPLSLVGSALRFDKLDQAETRSLLMCFLHIMRTISEGRERRKHNSLHFTRIYSAFLVSFHTNYSCEYLLKLGVMTEDCVAI